MTDKQSLVASSVIRDEHYNINTEVGCMEDGTVSYTFTAYDKSNSPSRFRRDSDDIGSPHAKLMVRVDQGSAGVVFDEDNKYANVAVIKYAKRVYSVPLEINAAEGNVVKFALDLDHGQSILTLDQRASTLAAVLHPCVAAMRDNDQTADADRAASTEEGLKQAAARQTQAEQTRQASHQSCLDGLNKAIDQKEQETADLRRSGAPRIAIDSIKRDIEIYRVQQAGC